MQMTTIEISYVVLSALITGIGTLGLVFLKQIDNNFQYKVDQLMTLYKMAIEESEELRQKYVEVGNKIANMEPRITRNENDIGKLFTIKSPRKRNE